jgi:hypothetical protein
MAEGFVWPPNYEEVYNERFRCRKLWLDKPELLPALKAYYKTRPAEFVATWCDTYDPRKAIEGGMSRMPFVPFPKQVELIEFLYAVLMGQVAALIEKSRDMGATWICVSLSNWLWLFWAGAAVGWGSRKEQLVDKIGDPDSIFEKIRMQLLGFPREFWPQGFDPKHHASYMKLVNPENGATITGEAGDNIGRGGRKLIYFKDESAHYERPERIEAALADNTNVQVDISSVNGIGNVFHRRREAGVVWVPGAKLERRVANVFIMDWRDHPAKDQAWHDERRAKAEADGLEHIMAQEVDRNYAAALQGVIIRHEWVKSAIDAHLVLLEADPDYYEGIDGGPFGGGFDVADEGLDRNAFVTRQGIIVRDAEEWGDRDPGVSARRAIEFAEASAPMAVQYDSIGVGAAVKAEINRLNDIKRMPPGVKFVPWNAGAAVQQPKRRVNPGDKQSLTNQDFFQNLKAQGWWLLGRRFEKTHRVIQSLKLPREQWVYYPQEELISLCSMMPRLRQLEKELCQPTIAKGPSMRLVVNKTPEGTRSPNMGDSTMMAFHPIIEYVPPSAVQGRWQ